MEVTKKHQEQPPEFLMKNAQVEVCSEEEGFNGAWFEAIVMSPPSNNKVYVEYKTRLDKEPFSFSLRERVDVGFVRPLPPMYNNPTLFELYDVVDAFYKDCWWSGVITRMYEKSRFLVTFQDPPHEIQFESSSLRLHFDWVNHKWVRPRTQKIQALMFREGKGVEVLMKIKHNQDVWYPATIVENHADMTFLVEYMTPKEGTNETELQKVTVDCTNIRPRPPPLKNVLFHLLEKVDALIEFGWWSGVITKALPDNRYSVSFQIMERNGEFDHTAIRPQLSWRDGKWWFASSQEEVTLCQHHEGLVDIELHDISSGETCKSEVIRKGENMGRKVPISSCSRESNPWETLSNSPATHKDVLVAANLEATEFPSSSLWKHQTDHVNLGQQKSHGVSCLPKKAKHSMKIPMQVEEKLKRGGDDVMPSRISTQQNTARKDKQKKNETIDSTCGSTPSNIPSENMLIDLISEDQPAYNPSWELRTDWSEAEKSSHKRKRGRPRKVSAGSLNAEITDGMLGGNNHFPTIDSSYSTVAQNGVLVDGDTMVERSAKLRQGRKELIGLTTSAKDNKTATVMIEEVDAGSLVLVEGNSSITTDGEPELPFQKSSSLWAVLESMEAIRKMPQKPHFRPLQQHKESSRESCAIAFMVTFSTIVDRISWLRIDNMKEKIDDILETLNDLESHGFGVQVLRDQITELESLAEKHKKLLEEVDVINNQIFSCKFDKAEQEKEISDMTNQIKKLEERIAKAESIKEMKDREIALLESRRQTAEETILSVRSRCERRLASGVS